MRAFVRSYKVFFIGVSLLSLGLFENRASAHIYQVSSLRMKDGKIVVFLFDAHHHNLTIESDYMGLDQRALQERADLEGQHVYEFLNQLLSNGLKINLLLEQTEFQSGSKSKSKSKSKSEKVFNLDTYLALSRLPQDLQRYDFFEFIQAMTSIQKVESVAIQGRLFSLHGFDNRREKEGEILTQLAKSSLHPNKQNLTELRQVLRTVEQGFAQSIYSDIQALVAKLERLFPEERALLDQVRARQANFSDILISEWARLSFEQWSEKVSEIRDQFNEWTNFKVDLNLLLHILTGEGPVVIIQGGGLHLGHAIEFLSSMSGVDQFSSKIGYDSPEFMRLFGPENTFSFETAVNRSLMEISHCPVCLKKTDQLLKCARCREEAYCGPVCQKKAWPKHKHQCKPASSAPAAAAVQTGQGAGSTGQTGQGAGSTGQAGQGAGSTGQAGQGAGSTGQARPRATSAEGNAS